MIVRLTGELILKRPPFLIIDVNNLAYELQAPMRTFYALPDEGTQVTVLTHLVVREDAHILYAFVDEYERELFKELLKISGIGARIGLAILSGMDVPNFRECINGRDVETLQKIPGIGKKTAERLIVEMQNRLDNEFWHTAKAGEETESGDEQIKNQAVEALLTLGYKRAQAKQMVKACDINDKTIEEVIRQALQQNT